MKDNFLLKQLAQAVSNLHSFRFDDGSRPVEEVCWHCDENLIESFHKPHCIVLVAEQILKGDEDE